MFSKRGHPGGSLLACQPRMKRTQILLISHPCRCRHFGHAVQLPLFPMTAAPALEGCVMQKRSEKAALTSTAALRPGGASDLYGPCSPELAVAFSPSGILSGSCLSLVSLGSHPLPSLALDHSLRLSKPFSLTSWQTTGSSPQKS